MSEPVRKIVDDFGADREIAAETEAGALEALPGVVAAVFARLDALGIEYARLRHPAVHTIGDCAAIDRALHSLTVKNYFLTTKNARRCYLLLTRPEARFRTADISRQAGSSRLSFGPEDALKCLLRSYPGAVSPMGLMFDAEHAVGLLVDRTLKDCARLSFHPCDNRCTLSMCGADFFGRFLPAAGVEPVFVDIHDEL